MSGGGRPGPRPPGCRSFPGRPAESRSPRTSRPRLRGFLRVCGSPSGPLARSVYRVSVSPCRSLSLPVSATSRVCISPMTSLCEFLSLSLRVCPSVRVSLCLCFSAGICLRAGLLTALTSLSGSLSFCLPPASKGLYSFSLVSTSPHHIRVTSDPILLQASPSFADRPEEHTRKNLYASLVGH